MKRRRTDDLTEMSSSSESGRMQKGAVNTVEIGRTVCNSRTARTAREDASAHSETGYRRSHGENHMDDCPCNLKSALEPSVWTVASLPSASMPSEPGCLCYHDWVCPEVDTPFSRSRIGRRSARPGAKPTTYRFVGFSFEHGNLNWSAGDANLGKLPSPAMSPMRGGVSIVVGARESRVHGEGRQ